MQPVTHMALRAARKAGELIARAGQRLDLVDVESKGTNDFVTEVDRKAEQEIIFQLSKTYPDHAFLGEESGLSGNADSEYRWIIDPAGRPPQTSFMACPTFRFPSPASTAASWSTPWCLTP